MMLFRFSILVFLLGCGAPAIVARPEVAKPTREMQPSDTGDWVVSPDQDALQFRTSEGLRAYLVPVHSKANPKLRNQFLVRITGSTSLFDGLVLLARRVDSSTWVEFSSTLHGEPYALLSYRKVQAATGEQPTWHLRGYDTDSDHGTVQIYKEPFDAHEIVRLRHEQRNSTNRRLETATRSEVEAAQNHLHKLLAESASEECGIDIQSSIEWSSVQEEWPERMSIASKCAPPLWMLRKICGQHGKRPTPVHKKVRIRCIFEADASVRTANTALRGTSDRLVYVPGYAASLTRSMIAKTIGALGLDTQILRNGKQFFVIRRNSEGSQLFQGDGKSFRPVAKSPFQRNTSYRLPSGAREASLKLTEGGWELRCGRATQIMEVLDNTQQDALLSNATFATERRWKREPYFLARDSKGTYYYVDRYKKNSGGGRYRVFVGRQGQVKLSKLKRLVEDSEGTLFSTNQGDLRLVVSSGSKTAVWIRAKKVTTLTTVRLKDNSKLIYDDLGVYYGEDLDLVCQ